MVQPVKFRTIEEVKKQLEGLDERDVVCNTKDIEISKTLGLRIPQLGNEFLPVGTHALPSLESRFKIPVKFLTEINDEGLTETVLKAGLQLRGIGKVRIVCRDGAIASIMGEKDPYISSLDGFEVITETIKDVHGFDNISTNGSVKLKLLTRTTLTPPKEVNDISHGGLNIYIGGRPSVGTYTYRLVCLNGAMGVRETMATTEGVTGDVRSRFKHMLAKQRRLACEEFLPQFINSTLVPVDNPERVIHAAATHARLSKELEAKILTQTSILGRTSYYELINIITNMANKFQDMGKSDTRDVLQRFGGELVHLSHKNHCTLCSRPV